MRPFFKRALVGTLATLAMTAAAVTLYASREWGRTVEAPYPGIQADRSPAAVAHGAAIFRSTCGACHVAPGGERASGAPMTDVPAFLGAFHAANLTADKGAGVGALRDEEIARIIRYGIDRHGHHTPMPSTPMSDADVAAVIGFMRSDDPLFMPVATVAPASRLSAVGKVIVFLSGGMKVPALPAQGIAAPAKGPTVAYGHYLTHAVYACADCHTPGFAADKIDGPTAFQGGFEFRDLQGQPVHSTNLTSDATGIAHYDSASLGRAVREGVRPDGSSISAPMPQFKGLEDVEVEAIFTYLRSLPPHHSDGAGKTRRGKLTMRE